jgi:ribosomal protein L31
MSGTVSKSSTTTKSSKYVYRSTGGAGADVTIEYSTDLSALARLEVLLSCHFFYCNHQNNKTKTNNANKH